MNLIQVPSQALTVNGQTAPVNVPANIKRGQFNANVTVVAGTTPTLDVFLEGLDDNGVWYTLYHPAQITAVSDVSQGVGDGMQTAVALPDTIRARWVIGGSAGPSFTTSISFVGQSEL